MDYRFTMPEPGYPIKPLPISLANPAQNHIKRRRDRLMHCNRIEIQTEV